MKKTKYTKKQISEAIKYWESVLTKMNESRHRQPKTRSINDQVKHCEQVYNGPEGNCYIYNEHFVWTDNEGNEIEPPQKIGGNFDCSNTKITSLEGAPREVGGFFSCSNTKITSLKGAPRKVGGTFDCSDTDITSLEGAPWKVDRSFDCSYCENLTSLKGAPQKVSRHFDCSDTKITSLKGAPQKVSGDFDCSKTNITSLEGAPQKVGGDFDCSDTDITSLDGAPGEVGEYFYCLDTNITSDQKFEYLQCLKHQKVSRASTIWSYQNPSSGHIDATGHYKERVKIN